MGASLLRTHLRRRLPGSNCLQVAVLEMLHAPYMYKDQLLQLAPQHSASAGAVCSLTLTCSLQHEMLGLPDTYFAMSHVQTGNSPQLASRQSSLFPDTPCLLDRPTSGPQLLQGRALNKVSHWVRASADHACNLTVLAAKSALALFSQGAAGSTTATRVTCP